MDGLKGRRKGSGQQSPPPDMDTFETIDNPHTIFNGTTAFL